MPRTLPLRRALSSFPTGVVAVCAIDANMEPVGMAVNSFTSISLSPPLVAVSVAHSSRTWPVLRALASLGLSVLSDGQEVVSRRLSAREGDRFQGIRWRASENGALLLEGAVLWLTCTMQEEIRAGDHEIVLLKVDKLEHFPDVEPLVFHRSQYRLISE